MHLSQESGPKICRSLMHTKRYSIRCSQHHVNTGLGGWWFEVIYVLSFSELNPKSVRPLLPFKYRSKVIICTSQNNTSFYLEFPEPTNRVIQTGENSSCDERSEISVPRARDSDIAFVIETSSRFSQVPVSGGTVILIHTFILHSHLSLHHSHLLCSSLT